MENRIMLYLALGYSSANNIQMDALWRINCSKGLTSSRLMPQLSNIPLYVLCSSWRFSSDWSLSKAMSCVPSLMEILNLVRSWTRWDLEPGENVYVEMPLGFSQYATDGTRKALKLKKIQDELCQSPWAFWKYTTKRLEACGLPKWFVLSKLTTSSFGTQIQWISIVQQYNCVSLALTLKWKKH